MEKLKVEVLEKVGQWGKKGADDLRCYVFSSRIIHQIKDIVVPHGLDVSWGHPISGDNVGPESDIIIFRDKPDKEWNGPAPVIRIVFVNLQNIIAIIECKKTIRIDRKNRSLIKDKDSLRKKIANFTSFGIPQKSLWLLSENIDYDTDEEKQRIENIVITQIGFSKFFSLFDEKNDVANESDWISFLNEIKYLR